MELRNLTKAHLDTELFRFSPAGPSPELTASMAQDGLLQPLAAVQFNGALFLTDGFKRLQTPGFPEHFPVLISPQPDAAAALLHAAALRFAAAEPDCVERARGMQLFTRFGCGTDPEQRLKALLRIPKRRDELFVLQQLPTWPEQITVWLAAHRIPLSRLRAAERCGELTLPLLEAFAMPLQLNANQIRNLLEDCGDLLTGGMTAGALRGALEQAVATHTERQQQIQILFAQLHSLRRPRFSAAVERFNCAAAGLPPGITAEHGNFDRDSYRFSFEAESPEALAGNARALEQFASSADGEALFKELQV